MVLAIVVWFHRMSGDGQYVRHWKDKKQIMGLMADRNMIWLPEQILWRCSTCPSPPPAARCPGHRAPTSCRPTAPSPRSAPSASPSGSRTQCSSADFCFSSITRSTNPPPLQQGIRTQGPDHLSQRPNHTAFRSGWRNSDQGLQKKENICWTLVKEKL